MRRLRLRVAGVGLVPRFAAVSLALMLLLGLALSQLLAGRIEHRGLESATDAAVLTTALAIQPMLGREDLRSGLSPETVANLDRALSGTTDGRRRAEIARIKIWNADQKMVYLADPHTVLPDEARSGDPSAELAETLEGHVEAEIVGHSIEADNRSLLRRYGTLLEVYVPIQYPGDAAPVGAFELYLPYEPVQRMIRADTVRAVGLLALGLVVLWLGLFRMVARASRRLREEAARGEHQALHDGLTDLPNRVLLSRLAEDAIGSAAADGHRVGLLVLDLDRFREVNDSLGHTTGDLLVREVAARLAAAGGPHDVVTRLGGDEFAVLLGGLRDQCEAEGRASRLLAAFDATVPVAGLDLAVQASAGLALWPDHAADAGALLQRADVAMYVAKSTHRPLAVYDPRTDEHSADRLLLLAELTRGIAAGELVLHYQPKTDLAGVPRGVEALVRWAHPQRGLLQPGEFLSLAESTGLIHPLTDAVLDAAVRQAGEWLRDGSPRPVAVNVSTRSLLDPGFAEKVLVVLNGHRVPAQLLCLEITETTIMEDPDRALVVLTALADAGVRLSIDDFGTGYSSLAYLKQLPVHELKIDRSFVSALLRSERDRVIVDSTVVLGHRLGLDVVAEGVEDEATRAALADLGCDLAQGFLFSRPVPAAELPPLPVAAPAVGPSGADFPSPLSQGAHPHLP